MARALSEKAKGKQRAVDPDSEAPAEPTKELTVRFTEGIPDLFIQVTKQDTARDVKDNIRIARPQLQNRRLRLIHSGRLLTDGTYLFKWLASLEERQHRDSAGEGETPQLSPIANWLHCSIGPELTEGEQDQDNTQASQIKPLRGFDRLGAAGFSEEDIANIRRQFHNSSASDYLDSEFSSEEDFDEHSRVLEEQWIDSFDNAGTASLSQSSSTGSTIVLQGMVIGFFFPLLPFFFLRESKPAIFWDNGQEHESMGSVIFSKRMQMGIVVGFLTNFSFGLWRYLLTN